MSMLTTRTPTRPTESHGGSFDPTRVSLSASAQPCSASLSSSINGHMISPQDRAAMGGNWTTAAASSSSSFMSDHPSFGQQGAADMGSSTAAAAASRGVMRGGGYATRSTTGSLVRTVGMNEQSTMGGNFFEAGSVAQNQMNGSGGVVRKKRRRYGPKPEPPYMCYCGKVFKRHEHMLRHRATHDDHIKYECPICGKCFRRQDVMHRHTMTHSSRGRLQNKMRNTVSASSSSLSSLTATAASVASGQNRQPGEEEKVIHLNRKREHEHANMGYGSNNHEMLEDPTLRVGLAEYPATPTSSRHNQDHHIAAAQLYNACNGTRYSYPSYQLSAPQPVYGGGMDMTEGAYARSESFEVMTADYHSRMAASMSPPPAFFPSAPGFAPSAIEADQFSFTMGRPHLSLSTSMGAGGYEYETKPLAQDAGHHYAQSWHGGYGLAHNPVHMGASESEWSEQSPSGPSTHTFASPAWSQKAEVMRREGASSASGTPLGLISNRQLSMEPASRWHGYSQHQQQLQLQQPHSQQYQQQLGSPMFGGNSEDGFASMERSPAHLTRRRLSVMHSSNLGSSLAQDGHAHGHSPMVKAESHGESGAAGSGGSGTGLALFDQSYAGHGSNSLGLLTTPTLANASTVNGSSNNSERLAVPQYHHASPHTSNGANVVSSSSSSSSSPSHYLGAGMNSMHVTQSSSYNEKSKPGSTSMSSLAEPFDTGSPLTEVTGNASPSSHSQSHAYGGEASSGTKSHGTAKQETSADAIIDPHLASDKSGYVSSSSTASLHGGRSDRRW